MTQRLLIAKRETVAPDDLLRFDSIYDENSNILQLFQWLGYNGRKYYSGGWAIWIRSPSLLPQFSFNYKELAKHIDHCSGDYKNDCIVHQDREIKHIDQIKKKKDPEKKTKKVKKNPE